MGFSIHDMIAREDRSMAKATLTFPNGSTVTVEGSQDEVEVLVRLLNPIEARSIEEAGLQESTRAGQQRQGTRQPSGPTGYIRRLKEEGFFAQKRSLSDLRTKLEEMGHIYSLENLSAALVKLVRSRFLRRIKEAGVWKYVNP